MIKHIPSPNHWNGREGHKAQWVILHGTDANTADYDGAYETASWFQTNAVSTNYVIGRAGLIAQCVQESDAPYANGGVTNNPYTGKKHDPWWGPVNPNLVTISIEHVKHAGNNNGDALTPAQEAASFELIYEICLRNSIRMYPANAQGGITDHSSMDPLNRTYCAGVYPWAKLWAFLNSKQKESSPMGEVATFNQANQFLPGRSAYECGFYAVYVVKSMTQNIPSLSPQEIGDLAQAAYQAANGSNSSSNMNGMSLPQLYSLLKGVGLHYQGTVLDLAHLRAWLRDGYPVIVAVAEPAIRDLDLGDAVPYPWVPSGNHVIVLTGLDGINFLARDTANIIAPNTLRPGPRRYDGVALSRGLVSATAVVPAWLPVPLGDINPNVTTLPVIPNSLPGWVDDKVTLTAPNGVKVIAGFRTHVLNGHWDPANEPLEAEHDMADPHYIAGLGTEGTGQLFRACYLRAIPGKGVHEVQTGDIVDTLLNERFRLAAQIEELKKQPSGPMTPELYQRIVQVENTLRPLADLYSSISNLKDKS